MKRSTLLLLVGLLLGGAAKAQTTRECGTNLAWARYWAPQIIFKDVFKQSAPWLTRNATGTNPWNTNVAIPTGPDGYPQQVPFGTPDQYAHTILLNNIGGHYPAGTYTILSEGTGTIQLEWDSGNHTFSSPCNNTFAVTPSNQGIHLTITASDANDPVRNIRIILPGYEADYLSQPFYPPLLNYIDSANVFKALRCMDLMNTNNSTVSTWNQRTSRNHYTQANLNAGVNYETLIQLANQTGRDIWINIPHQADDQYIAEFARLLRDSLDPSLKTYVEYSNEVWNNIFQQNLWANTQGAALGYTGQAWEQGWKYYAKRSADIHRIFEDTLGASSGRLVKVVSSQSANSYIANYIMTQYNDPQYNPTGVQADALSIAPYFGNNIADSIGDAGGISTVTAQDLLNLLQAAIPSRVLPQVTAHKTIADTYGLELIAYEGGTHLVATDNAYFTDSTLTAKILEANRDPFMETIYCEYFDTWYDNGGGLFMNFTSPAFNGGQWASLSIIEDMDQPLYSSGKWRAMHNCASTDSLSGIIAPDMTDSQLLLYPNPFTDQLTLSAPFELQGAEISLLQLNGQKIRSIRATNGHTMIIPRDNLAPGTYLLHIQAANRAPSSVRITVLE